MGQMKSLRGLSLYHNQLTLFPKEVLHLASLTNLNLEYNSLILTPSELRQVESLKIALSL
jgi:Leucine-rich repeat (LRR) protein